MHFDLIPPAPPFNSFQNVQVNKYLFCFLFKTGLEQIIDDTQVQMGWSNNSIQTLFEKFILQTLKESEGLGVGGARL